MRIAGYALGALAVATALAYAHDTAGTKAVAGTATPLSIESMRTLADDACKLPPGYRSNTLQMLESSVLEVGVTDSQVVLCVVDQPDSHTVSTLVLGSPVDRYFDGRMGLVNDDGVIEVGRITAEVAALEFVLPDEQIFKAELYGEIYLCRIPMRVTAVRVRAYDAHGRLLRDGVI